MTINRILFDYRGSINRLQNLVTVVPLMSSQVKGLPGTAHRARQHAHLKCEVSAKRSTLINKMSQTQLIAHVMQNCTKISLIFASFEAISSFSTNFVKTQQNEPENGVRECTGRCRSSLMTEITPLVKSQCNH